MDDKDVASLLADRKTCKMLKALGFNESCIGYWEDRVKKPKIYFINLPLRTKEEKLRPKLYRPENRNSELPPWEVSALTWDQVKRWLFKKYSICFKLSYNYDIPVNYCVNAFQSDILIEYTGLMIGSPVKAEMKAIKLAVEYCYKRHKSIKNGKEKK